MNDDASSPQQIMTRAIQLGIIDIIGRHYRAGSDEERQEKPGERRSLPALPQDSVTVY